MTRNNKLITLFLLAIPLMSWAQDDMYFVPKKKAKTQQAATTQRSIPVEIVYADDESLDITGSTRDVDEYNRRTPVTTTGEAQLVQQTDGSFALQVSADDAQKMSASELYTQGYRDGYLDGEDYTLTRRMGRFNYVSVYSSPWYWSVRYDPFYWDDWYWSRPYWGYYGYYGYYGYRPYYSWGWGYNYHRPYYYGYRRPYNVGRPAYPGGGHMGRGTQYRDRYYNLRTADRNYVTPRNRTTQRSVRGGGQSAPMGSRGSSYINGGQGSSSSTVTPSTSRSGSSSSSRSYSGSSSVTSRAGSASVSRGGNAGGGFGGGGSRGGGGGGSRGGGSRGGRR